MIKSLSSIASILMIKYLRVEETAAFVDFQSFSPKKKVAQTLWNYGIGTI